MSDRGYLTRGEGFLDDALDFSAPQTDGLGVAFSYSDGRGLNRVAF